VHFKPRFIHYLFFFINNMASSSITELNAKFGKDHHLKVEEGESGLPKVVLQTNSGAKLEIYLNGGTVSSFKRGDGEELIFVSSKAVFQQGKAIRGGIPVCFPQFGPGELPQHGFARTSQFKIKESHVEHNGASVSVILLLEDNEETRKVWNHAFGLELVNTIEGEKGKETFHQELRVTNRNKEEPFSFTTALHTYFKVKDIFSTTVHGLKGITYIDKVNGGKKVEETSDNVAFTGETDRVYLRVPGDVHIQGKNETIILKRHNFPETIVWNLWTEKAKAMADMGDEDWKGFACAEAGFVESPVNLKGGQTWIGKQEISKL